MPTEHTLQICKVVLTSFDPSFKMGNMTYFFPLSFYRADRPKDITMTAYSLFKNSDRIDLPEELASFLLPALLSSPIRKRFHATYHSEAGSFSVQNLFTYLTQDCEGSDVIKVTSGSYWVELTVKDWTEYLNSMASLFTEHETFGVSVQGKNKTENAKPVLTI